MKNLDIKLLENETDPEFIKILDEYAEAAAFYPDSTIAVNDDFTLAVHANDIGNRLVNTSSNWGVYSPGASLDCVGSVTTVLSATGVTKPIKDLRKLVNERKNELEDKKTLNMRLQRFLLKYVMFKAHDEYEIAPLKNPAFFYPLDSFAVPHTFAVQGERILPHTMIAIRKNVFLSADFASRKLKLIDLNKLNKSLSWTIYANGTAGYAFRVFKKQKGTEYDTFSKKVLTYFHEKM